MDGSISGFALPSMIHNNQPPLQLLLFWNLGDRLVRYHWYSKNWAQCGQIKIEMKERHLHVALTLLISRQFCRGFMPSLSGASLGMQHLPPIGVCWHVTTVFGFKTSFFSNHFDTKWCVELLGIAGLGQIYIYIYILPICTSNKKTGGTILNAHQWRLVWNHCLNALLHKVDEQNPARTNMMKHPTGEGGEGWNYRKWWHCKQKIFVEERHMWKVLPVHALVVAISLLKPLAELASHERMPWLQAAQECQ